MAVNTRCITIQKSISVIFIVVCVVLCISCNTQQTKKNVGANNPDLDILRGSFIFPPDHAKPRTYWWWLFNRVDKEGITRDLEEFKAKGDLAVSI